VRDRRELVVCVGGGGGGVRAAVGRRAPGQKPAVGDGRRETVTSRDGGCGGGGGGLPRRQWRRQAATPLARAGSHIGDHLIARRQRHLLTSTVHPVLGHWRALHDKLDVQSMWPGTARYADERYLPATTVRTLLVQDQWFSTFLFSRTS